MAFRFHSACLTLKKIYLFDVVERRLDSSEVSAFTQDIKLCPWFAITHAQPRPEYKNKNGEVTLTQLGIGKKSQKYRERRKQLSKGMAVTG